MNLSFEKDYPTPLIGVDEAGRGPWAGPVVAGAVYIDFSKAPLSLLDRIQDSKKLTPKQRASIFQEMKENEAFLIGLGQSSVEEIEKINILKASLLAMRRAVESLSFIPQIILVDGNKGFEFFCPVKTLVKGDTLSVSIAAASICAKVTRDYLMDELSQDYPYYGWEKNKGYGTLSHRDAIAYYGPSPHHRMGFKPLQAYVQRPQEESIPLRDISEVA